MINSILNSIKKVLGLEFSYTPFDNDIIIHINSVFSILNQLGIGPSEGFMIDGDEETWDSYNVPPVQLHLVKTYMFLKVRSLFDPPGTSYLIEAMNEQIRQYEWRLSTFRENVLQALVPVPVPEEEVW